MLGLLSVFLGILGHYLRYRLGGGRPVSLGRARRVARKTADLLELVKKKGADRREELVKAVVSQGVPEPLARIVVEEAAARYSLKARRSGG